VTVTLSRTFKHAGKFDWRPTRLFAAAVLASASIAASAQSNGERQLDEAAELIRAFTDNGPDSIPAELLDRARGIAVVPNVFRGGFILGARRGRGVMSIRSEDGRWSNPAFVTLTGGSIGWQIGAESTDVVLIFANENAIKNIASGKFTLGGEASAVAGPLRKQASSTMTFRAEVYGYLRSRGLYAGAAFQGARLKLNDDLAAEFYGPNGSSGALQPTGAATPAAALRFLQALGSSERAPERGDASPPRVETPRAESGLKTFPLPD
jgi:lipid-binding SYLF domain-containing protein